MLEDSKNKNLKKTLSGQSLFEVVLALAISTIILVAVVSLVTVAVRNSSFSKNKTLAGRHAQEVQEWLRGERDGDWDVFYGHATDSSLWCMIAPSWDNIGQCPATGYIDRTIFKRETTFRLPDPLDPTNVESRVRVFWQQSGRAHEIESITNFTDWRTIIN